MFSYTRYLIKGFKMRETTQQKRFKSTIHFIQSHPNCTTADIAKNTGATIRTIQLDLDYLRKHWKDGVLISKRGIHSVKVNKQLSQKALEEEKKIFLKLSLETLKNLSNLSDHCSTINEELNLTTLSTPYFVKSETYQTLKTYQENDEDIEDIRNLSEAIKKDLIVEFVFHNKRYHVEPYRLVNFDGIWYLYGRDKEERIDNDHKTWMLKDIDKVEIYYDNTHSTSDAEIDKDLEEAHSANFVVDTAFNVKLRVSANIADIFRQRNHLPKQNSTLQEDGSLIVISTISTYADIDPEIKSWLPYIEILEPLSYREKFIKELSKYLESLR